MSTFSISLAASAAVLAFVGLATAQESAQPQDIDLPAACQTGEAPGMAGMENMQSGMENMGEHQQAYMQAMMQTQDESMTGIMAEDADVAFACGMMAHHQAAINMARVQLRDGDNDQIKQMAQKIIDDQQREIEQFREWLQEQGQ